MRRTEDKGFTLICILVITLVLFSLVSLALSANYSLHSFNKRMSRDLQKRANKLQVTPSS